MKNTQYIIQLLKNNDPPEWVDSMFLPGREEFGRYLAKYREHWPASQFRPVIRTTEITSEIMDEGTIT